jgi:cell division protein FtsW (lipid II flippase)
MAKRVSVDRWMFTVTTILVFVGLVMIFSASAVMAKERFGSAYEFLFKQLIWAVAGLAVMVVAMKVDYKRLQHPALVFSFLGLTTLLLISVFFLDRAHGTHRWFHVGPVSLQPSELAKPALILFLAWFLENKTKAMDDWRNTLIPAVVPTLVFLGLIVFQPDLGTAIACAGITACILFVAGIRLRYFGIAAAALFSGLSRFLSKGPDSCFYESLCGSEGIWISYYPVADCGFYRRRYRTRINGREAKIVLPSGAAHGFHFCGYGGGVGIGRSAGCHYSFCDFSVAGNPGGFADAG